ncbi:hypothetical protein HMPREF9080_00571 [Cardiobacterium valvarum F0432]|uniref:Uncharacterized protein n=1 Tax=Cardiobacterium valvarum F0432 TaxID=797473 RepID=G9ZCU2_9GAMM|nr:hypothetical protein HMPREF9080_00571 [Cardiobacterium valvarum F0432]
MWDEGFFVVYEVSRVGFSSPSRYSLLFAIFTVAWKQCRQAA